MVCAGSTKRVKSSNEPKRASMSHIRFGRPSVRWLKRDGGLSRPGVIADGGIPGVGGAMCAELLPVRLCIDVVRFVCIVIWYNPERQGIVEGRRKSIRRPLS